MTLPIPSFWTRNPEWHPSAITIIGRAMHTETGEALYVCQMLSKKHHVILLNEKEITERFTLKDASPNPLTTFAMHGMAGPPGVYRHYKSPDMLYEVYGLTDMTYSAQHITPHVLYSTLYGDRPGQLFARPYSTEHMSQTLRNAHPNRCGFFEWVNAHENAAGHSGPRFQYVRPMETSQHPLLYKPSSGASVPFKSSRG